MTTDRVAAAVGVLPPIGSATAVPTAGATMMMGTAAAGTETPVAMPKRRGAAGRAEAIRAVTTMIAQEDRIADMEAGSGTPAAILTPPAVDGKTAAEDQGCVRSADRAHLASPPLSSDQ